MYDKYNEQELVKVLSKTMNINDFTDQELKELILDYNKEFDRITGRNTTESMKVFLQEISEEENEAEK